MTGITLALLAHAVVTSRSELAAQWLFGLFIFAVALALPP